MALVGGSSDGIQKLLAAEQEAQRIVAEARKGVLLLGEVHAAAKGRLCQPSPALIITRSWRGLLAPPLLNAGKADRLRQAKIEADKEIAAYKAEREGAYQKKVAEVW